MEAQPGEEPDQEEQGDDGKVVGLGDDFPEVLVRDAEEKQPYRDRRSDPKGAAGPELFEIETHTEQDDQQGQEERGTRYGVDDLFEGIDPLILR